MRKRKLLSFLALWALFFCLVSCGIPRMFPWRKTYQYDYTNGPFSGSMTFSLDFNTESSSSGSAQTTHWNLVPSPDTPILRFYYLIIPEPEYQSSVQGIVSSFTNRYSSSFPKSFGSGEAAYTSTYTSSGTDDERISVSLYELTVIPEGQKPIPASEFFKGIQWFEPILQEGEQLADGELADNYEANYSFVQDTNGVTNGYYIEMTLNGATYRLARSNGEPFSYALSSYYDDEDSEFLPEDAGGIMSNAVLRIYVTASFAFENYTTRRTIQITGSDYAYENQLVN